MLKREKNFREAYFEEVEAARVARNELRDIRRELFRDRLRPLPALFNPDASEEDTDNEMPGLESDSENNSRSQEVDEAKRSRPE